MTRNLIVLALVSLLLAACSAGANDDGRETVRLVNSKGASVRLRVEVADEPAELAKGLSGRDGLGQDEGMLFVIERRGPGFWMKDVSFPLSVAFISGCGQIVALAEMEPHSLEIHSTDRDYRFGLEVSGGWFAAHAIAVGDRLELPAALRQSGCG